MIDIKDFTIDDILVTRVDTAAGKNFRFWKVVEKGQRSASVMPMGVISKKIDSISWEVSPDFQSKSDIKIPVHKDTLGAFIGGEAGKKALQKVYFKFTFNPRIKFVNVFDAGKLK